MADTWIIGVLDDLAEFARRNNLPRLNEHLQDASVVAVAELESRSKGPRKERIQHGLSDRAILEVVGSRDGS